MRPAPPPENTFVWDLPEFSCELTIFCSKEIAEWLDKKIKADDEEVERLKQRIKKLESALRMVLDDPDSLSGRPRTLEVVMEALGQT